MALSFENGTATLMRATRPSDAVGGKTPRAGRVPTWLKVLYTGFIAVLVPAYWWYYGPGNFLWFSDIALLMTVPALWLESRFLASMQAVSVVLLELLWVIDFVFRLAAGVSVVGLSNYMFDPTIPAFIRGLSLFHLVLPFLLLWLVWRLGYDRRAWLAQTAVAPVVLAACYFFTDPSDNVNWVFGPGKEPQTWMPPAVYLALLMAAFPVGVYLPTHLALRKAFGNRTRETEGSVKDRP